MKSTKNLRAERLEDRTLLAADLGIDPVELTPPQPSVGSPLPTDLIAPDQPGGAIQTGETPGGRVGSPPQSNPNREQPSPEVRSIDGSGNNVQNPEWGSTDEQLLRLTTVEYADGVSDPAGADRPSARAVSNAASTQMESFTNDRQLTDLLWLWGQFVDHDIGLTENAAGPAEPLSIEVPTGDPFFDPGNTGTEVIGFNRSAYDSATGDSADNPRQQINQITAFLDGSVVYGSDQERADALRTFEGGRLKTSDGNLLPFNEDGLPNAGGTSDSLFLAGDVRANENAALSAMHTIWVREHNRLAGQIATRNPLLSDEQVYQRARATVTAEIQAITFNEFLPALLGRNSIGPYRGYDPDVDPGIANIFSTAAYRFGHSMLSSTLLRANNDGSPADEGNLELRDAFFAPGELTEHGIDTILRGAALQQAQEIDTHVVDDVRNFLFGPPGSGGFDLVSLNIQRGRDHALADYNQARIDYGLDPVTSFAEITSDPALQAALEETYGDVNNIDVWVGALAEDHVRDSSMGELNQAVLTDQFERLRDGDRFWYERIFSGRQLREIERTTLRDVIERNSDVTGLQRNVFFDSTARITRSRPNPRDLAAESPLGIPIARRDAGFIVPPSPATRQTPGTLGPAAPPVAERPAAPSAEFLADTVFGDDAHDERDDTLDAVPRDAGDGETDVLGMGLGRM